MFKKIYIVEDSNIIRKQLVSYFQNTDYEVSDFENSLDALEAIENDSPDYLILDFYLPDINGDEFMVRLSEKLLIGNIKAILISSQDLSTNDQIKLATLGILKCLKKPVNKHQLLDIISKL